MDTQAPHLVDEILEDIFLRLPTPAALARASTACPRFRGIITDRPFLRRFRKLHPPPLLGFAYGTGFLPVQAPHPSAPLARAFADAVDFSCSFLPKCSEEYWARCDARDGRVLLKDTRILARGASFKNLAVCDPLSRRYVLLPPIPKEMEMTAQQDSCCDLGANLAPIGEDEDETSFKVVCTASYESKLVVFVFSSVAGQWCITASATWSSLGIAEPLRISWSHSTYLDGCLYLAGLFSHDKLLVLDTHSMEFSTVDFHTGYHVQLTNQSGQSLIMTTVVDGTKGALEMLTLSRDHSRDSDYLYHTTQQNNGESSNEWQLKNMMELPRGRFYFARGATKGFLFIRDFPAPDGWLPKEYDINLYAMEVKTFELKMVCSVTYQPDCVISQKNKPDCVHSYFGFPPPLSIPSL